MKKIDRLSAIQVARAVVRATEAHAPGAKVKRTLLHDGAGLYLVIRPPNGASWFLRYSAGSKPRWHGLGAFPTITLAEARQRATAARRQLAVDGQDPIAARAGARTALEAAKGMTFGQCATAYVASHAAGWRAGAGSTDQWTASLAAHVLPVIGSLPVAAVDTALVMKILEPIWNGKTETASRVRGRVESILDYARVRGYRTGENPARWRGHLEALLPARAKVRKVEHHPALPYGEIPEFMARVRAQEGSVARALEFLVLTAARAGEIRGARWNEIDLAARLWTIPPGRMKAGKEHRVPLSDRAVAILETLRPDSANPAAPVFLIGSKPLHNTALAGLLKHLGQRAVTVHGMRSTFSTWAAEMTNCPNEVAEAALAHQTGNAVERAYRRTDALEKRRELMTAYAAYCQGQATADNVVPIRAAG